MRFIPAKVLGRFWIREDGQDMVEYALMAGFIAVLSAASIPNAMVAVSQVFAAVAGALNGVSTTITTS